MLGTAGVEGVVGVGTDGDAEGAAAADGVVDAAGAGAPWGDPAAGVAAARMLKVSILS